MDWNNHCFLTVHWNIPTHPCQVYNLVQPLYHYFTTCLQHFSSDPTDPRSFPFFSLHLFEHILLPYLSFHQLHYTSSVGNFFVYTCTPHFTLLCIVLPHARVMQSSFHLFLTASSSHGTCPLSSYIPPTTLLPFHLAFNLCQKAFLVVQAVPAKFH